MISRHAAGVFDGRGGRQKGERDAEEEIQRSGDDRGVEADGGGANGGRCGAGVGLVEAHHLRVEGEVRRDERERGATSAATRRRESAIKEAGRRSEPGQGDAESGD